jgi:hypothetical protein
MNDPRLQEGSMSFGRLFTLFAVCPMFLAAQSERGNITGIVTDPAGAAISGARLTITHLDTNATLTAIASESGEYNAPNLLPGKYRVEITAAGFKRFLQENVVVAAASTARLDAQLQIGAVTETVEVTANAVQIQVDDAKVSTHVQNKLVDELPLVVGGEMRSPFNLVQVAAQARGDGQEMSLGGGQVASWNATLDGHSVGTNRSSDTAESALNTPSVEALTEFTVDTNGFKAEYGQAGGGVMTFASKSGTNRLQGVVYDFLRNDAMDARGFFGLQPFRIQAERFRRHCQRPNRNPQALRRPEQELLLLFLRRIPEPRWRQRHHSVGAHSGDVPW